jgi:hypothetical protein
MYYLSVKYVGTHTLKHMFDVYPYILFSRQLTSRLLKLYFYIMDEADRWYHSDYGAGHKAKRLMLQCINGVISNPVKGRTKNCQLKNLILTLLG